MRVKAAVARAQGAPLSIEDLDLDDPQAGEILVRMIASGVAAGDLAAIAGELAMPLPFVPGCEGAGIVERVGEGVTVPSAGDAVLIVGLPSRAPASGRLDGSAPFIGDDGAVNGFFFGQSSFATHLLCPAALAVPVADGAPLELLAGLGREVLLGAGLVLQELAVEAGSTIVITGADAVGLGACMAAAAAGAGSIILADPRESRRELALQVGATIAVPADDGLGSVVMSLAADGARYALETSGAPAARAGCEASLGANGRCHVADEADLARLDLRALIPRLVEMHAEDRFPLERLVAYFPFELVNDALAALSSCEVAKPVVRFSLGSFGNLDRALQEGAAQEEPEGDDGGSEPADAPAEGEREAPPVTA